MAGFPKADEEYAGRYRIVREIGHGGMGIVYEAVDTVLNRSVALKILLPSLPDRDGYQARFAREASVLAQIRSRHIVGIHEYGEHDDTVFFITELFPDGDLQHWLTERGALDRRSSLLLVAQLCEALADAHASGVVHRDVKPGNVLLWRRSDGLIPYLCDFGIALDGQRGLTRAGALIGSPAYMAPERHFGHAADERGDLYSVGCVLWAALTGDAPFSGTDFQMMNSHINEATPQLDTGDPVDQRIDEVLADLMHKDPERRPASAEAVRQSLLGILRDIDLPVAGEASVEPEVSPAPITTIDADADADADTAPERARSGTWLVAGVLVAMLLGGIAAAVTLSGMRDAPQLSPATTPVEAGVTSAVDDAVAPPTPPPPTVTTTSGYRSVDFTATAPRYRESAAALLVEYRVDGGWQPADGRLTIRTPVGGAETCVRFRSRAITVAGAEATSRATRECARAQPPMVRFVRSDDPCVNSAGDPCTWYDVAVSGFRDNVSPRVNVRRVNGEPWCDGCVYDRVEVGQDGRGYLEHDWKISRDEGQVILDVSGITAEFHLFR